MLVISSLVVFSLHIVSSNELSFRIVKGRPAVPRQWPFIVSLKVQGHRFCGGSLIHDMQWVLTAGHCCINHVKSGIKAFDGTQYRQVVAHYLHEDYLRTPNSIQNDICLLKLNLPFTSLSAKPILLGGTVGLNQTVSVAGWGVGSHNTLQKCHMTTDPCPIVQDNNLFFCTKDSRVGTGKGDSGGPVVMNGTNLTLVGVVSGGYTIPGLPESETSVGNHARFTRVDIYREWIRSKLGEAGTNFIRF